MRQQQRQDLRATALLLPTEVWAARCRRAGFVSNASHQGHTGELTWIPETCPAINEMATSGRGVSSGAILLEYGRQHVSMAAEAATRLRKTEDSATTTRATKAATPWRRRQSGYQRHRTDGTPRQRYRQLRLAFPSYNAIVFACAACMRFIDKTYSSDPCTQILQLKMHS